MSKDLIREKGEGLVPRTPITASPISHRIQEIGQGFLSLPQFQQVGEDVFTSCLDPLESLGDRLIRARDRDIPLVEVRLLRKEFATDEIRELFGVRLGPLVHRILRTDGQQQSDGYWGNHIPYEEIGLSNSQSGLVGSHKSKVTSFLDTGKYIGYDDSGGDDLYGNPRRPALSASTTHEDSGLPLIEAHPQTLQDVLDQIILDADVALRREGAIDATAVEIVEVPTERHLGGEPLQLPPASTV